MSDGTPPPAGKIKKGRGSFKAPLGDMDTTRFHSMNTQAQMQRVYSNYNADSAQQYKKQDDQLVESLTTELEDWELAADDDDDTSSIEITPTNTIEVFDFPASFRTHDLIQIFAGDSLPSSSIRIKWINDTSALIGFENQSQAKRAYISALTSPLLSARTYHGPPIPSFEPTGPRPVKTDLVARRLIAGALGVRAPRKNREVEEQKLKDAKSKREEEKRAKEKREEEVRSAWDG
ncbi:Coiled-coil domain-containing protein r3hcc1l [Chytridiales sp. JEL 0842]|nr:Coiled-coil domain-containing protein r3hcc1l [Chytridiales sp. JEL 0842]